MRFAFHMVILSVLMLCLPCAFAADPIQSMVDALNAARYRNGSGQLWFSDALMNAARTHAADMGRRNYFSHITPEGWSVDMRLQGWGWPLGAPREEVIGGGSGDAWATVNGWLNSSYHRGAILNGYYREVGIGHYYNPNSDLKNYWCVIVGSH